uniref:Uncharacterized protein n=1 Tax=Oryza barthii TaxID=65489 RepID=A0A0D3GFJ7_9ORYZ
MQSAVVLDLLGLLGAYAAGSCREWETSAYVVALVAAVVVYIAPTPWRPRPRGSRFVVQFEWCIVVM